MASHFSAADLLNSKMLGMVWRVSYTNDDQATASQLLCGVFFFARLSWGSGKSLYFHWFSHVILVSQPLLQEISPKKPLYLLHADLPMAKNEVVRLI